MAAEKNPRAQLLGTISAETAQGRRRWAFSISASFVLLWFLLWQECQIFVILKSTVSVKQQPPVAVNYHRPVPSEHSSQAHSTAPATCTLQLSKHGMTRPLQGQPAEASSPFPSMAGP